MKNQTKCLIAIGVVQLVGILLLVNVYSNLVRPDATAFDLSGQFFKGDDQTKFVIAVGNTRHAMQLMDYACGAFFVSIIVTIILAYLAWSYRGKNDS